MRQRSVAEVEFLAHFLRVWRVKATGSGLGRWKLALQEFSFDMHHVSGKENALAESVSRQQVNMIEIEP